MKKLSLQQLGRTSAEAFRTGQKNPVILVADHIRSGHNVGSLFRIADAFAFEEVYLVGFSPAPPNNEVEKTALGASQTVKWQHSDLENFLIWLDHKKKEGYVICVVEQTDESILLQNYRFEKSQKYILIFGNEVHGISLPILPLAESALEIPQWGTKHSINVSVAAGIVSWEVVRHFTK